MPTLDSPLPALVDKLAALPSVRVVPLYHKPAARIGRDNMLRATSSAEDTGVLSLSYGREISRVIPCCRVHRFDVGRRN